MSKFIRLMLFIGIIVIAYGFLCRPLHVDFFWESDTFGWVVFIIGLALLLVKRIKVKRETGRKAIGEKIGVGLSLLAIVLIVIINIVMNNSDAVRTAKNYILTNDSLKREMGDIRGFGFTYSGGMEVSSDQGGEEGSADISLIVKGSKKFRDLEVYVVKEKGGDWKVENIH
ncbi:hypothetical protein [Puia dinghuensis]|uniref:Uncharacterized protein n=1 Tax=Puia dinghuensis TaxID=1792502 RepID=A0A8J2U8P9_9BACT|nr:hypothetical protein [Puia dinghuensis]GGA86900.1 hypothetical protein GCM10011511_07480 [Puia dinghuensis]